MAVSASDKYLRITSVCEWISQGYSNNTLHKLIEEKFGLASYCARNKVIKDALAELYDDFDKEYLRRMNTEKLSVIIEQALTDGKYKEALDAIDKTNKLAGLYAEKKEVKVETDVISIKFGN